MKDQADKQKNKDIRGTRRVQIVRPEEANEMHKMGPELWAKRSWFQNVIMGE